MKITKNIKPLNRVFGVLIVLIFLMFIMTVFDLHQLQREVQNLHSVETTILAKRIEMVKIRNIIGILGAILMAIIYIRRRRMEKKGSLNSSGYEVVHLEESQPGVDVMLLKKEENASENKEEREIE